MTGCALGITTVSPPNVTTSPLRYVVNGAIHQVAHGCAYGRTRYVFPPRTASAPG